MDTILNFDGQPVIRRFNASRNRDKATYVLRGILEGVVADEKLNEAEIMFLDIWMRSQQPLEDNGDVIDLLEYIGDILEDGYVSKQELSEIHSFIDDVLDYGVQSSETDEDNINELIGLLLGISADGKLTDGEFAALDQWLSSNAHLADTYPANELIKRIKEIKADGVVDEEEKEDLLEAIKKLTGYRFTETGDAEGAVAEVFSKTIENFTHSEQKICFTGKFVSGTRKVCEKSAKDKGAIIAKSVTKDLDILILGTIASRDWRFTSHGRKIEKAVKYNNDGTNIIIISERTWLKHCKNAHEALAMA